MVFGADIHNGRGEDAGEISHEGDIVLFYLMECTLPRHLISFLPHVLRLDLSLLYFFLIGNLCRVVLGSLSYMVRLCLRSLWPLPGILPSPKVP